MKRRMIKEMKRKMIEGHSLNSRRGNVTHKSAQRRKVDGVRGGFQEFVAKYAVEVW
jgi:hypothetical protein